jgi:hypothetical protein
MPLRRLEDRIRALSAKVLATPESSPEFLPLIRELQAALKEQVERMRKQFVDGIKRKAG